MVALINGATVEQFKEESAREGFTNWVKGFGEELIMSGSDHLGMFVTDNLEGALSQTQALYAGFGVFRMFQIEHGLDAVYDTVIEVVQARYSLAPHEEAILIVDRLLKGENPEVGRFILMFSENLKDEQVVFVAAMAYEMCQSQLQGEMTVKT